MLFIKEYFKVIQQMNCYKKILNPFYINTACTESEKKKAYSDGEPLGYSAGGSNMDGCSQTKMQCK